MITVDVEQGSEAWHEIRAGKITGTRFASVMAGKDTAKYKDLIIDLAGEIITGEKEESYSNSVMERGVEMEDEARKAYEELFSVKISQIGFCIDDSFDEWVGISPDGFIQNEKGMTEFKCPIRKTHMNYIRMNKLPSVYKWQVQGGLMVSGYYYCDFMSYRPDMKPFIIRVYPDLEMHEQLTNEINIVIEEVRKQIVIYNEYAL